MTSGVKQFVEGVPVKKHYLYGTWQCMRQRCKNPRHRQFSSYGGRGITVCSRWENSFAAFVEDMGSRPPKHSIDRIDNDGNYEPSNCRWATPRDQNYNRNVQKNNATGLTGVSKRGVFYRARLGYKWKLYEKDGFETAEEAGEFRDLLLSTLAGGE